MPPDSEGDAGTRLFEVAFICTGNRARSPFAAALLERHLRGRPFAVSSYGTLELGPVRALPEACRVARSAGIELTHHHARALREGDLAGVALAIGFESIHVASAVVKGGAERGRTFLLAELARLVSELDGRAIDAGTPDRLVALANAKRSEMRGSALSIADPVGQSERTFRETFEQIERDVFVVAASLLRACTRE